MKGMFQIKAWHIDTTINLISKQSQSRQQQKNADLQENQEKGIICKD